MSKRTPDFKTGFSRAKKKIRFGKPGEHIDRLDHSLKNGRIMAKYSSIFGIKKGWISLFIVPKVSSYFLSPHDPKKVSHLGKMRYRGLRSPIEQKENMPQADPSPYAHAHLSLVHHRWKMMYCRKRPGKFGLNNSSCRKKSWCGLEHRTTLLKHIPGTNAIADPGNVLGV
jgi:hypothetical protein